MGEIRDRPEGPLSAKSGSSWIRRQWSDDVSLNDRYRLEAAVQIIELRPAIVIARASRTARAQSSGRSWGRLCPA